MFIQPSLNRESILEFFRKYFISPITEISGYNWVNTTVYGLLLSIAAIIAYRAVKQTDYEINLDLFTVFLPYLVFGSTVRALVDAEVYPYTYLLVTPGIFFTILFLFTIVVLLINYLKKNVDIELGKTVFIVGCMLVAYQIALLIPLIQSSNIGLILTGSSAAIYLVMWALHRILQEKIPLIRSQENFLVLLFHLLDATVTFIGVELYGYRELHILPHTLIELFGSAIILFPLKIVVLPFVLYVVDSYVEEQEMSVFIKMIIMGVGLVPTIRNSLRLVIGV